MHMARNDINSLSSQVAGFYPIIMIDEQDKVYLVPYNNIYDILNNLT